MNAKVENQIARMKNQTVGVEVEMNGITRSRQPARLQNSSGQQPGMLPVNTVTAPGLVKTRTAEFGSSKRMSALPVQRVKSVKWSHRFSPIPT